MSFKALLSISILLITTLSLSAQNLPERTTERARNRAENRANNQVDRGVDKAVDGAIDAVGGLFRRRNRNNNRNNNDNNQSTEQPAEAPDMSGLMGGGDWEPYTNPVSFSVDMEMKTINRRGREEANSMKMAISPNAWGMYTTDRDAETRMILDTQTGKVVTVSTDDGETQAFRMRMPGLVTQAEMAEVVEDQMADMTINRTGEYRTIDGHNCEKIIFTNEEDGDVTTAWVTNDFDLQMMDLAGPFVGMSRGRNGSNAMQQDFMGFPIESTTVSENGEQVEMKFRNIKIGGAADHSILDISGLEIQDLGF